jgi:diguanylate cyclase (GGDEF)-like protein/PAS domain S-box-containing protein
MTDSRATVIRILLLALAYALLGYAGLLLAIPPGYASPVFPAAGLALVAALHLGPKALPGIWLGSALLNHFHAWMNGFLTLDTSLLATVIATAAMFQALVGRYLVLRWHSSAWEELETELSSGTFLLLGGALACVCSASISVLGLYGFGIISQAEFSYSWWNWYIGDTLGVLIFAPMLITLLHGRSELGLERRRRMLLPMSLLLGTIFVAFFGASRWESQSMRDLLRDDGAIIAEKIGDYLISHQEILASLKRFVKATPHFTFGQFEHFTLASLKAHPEIWAMSFNEWVHDQDRAEYEQQLRLATAEATSQITQRSDQHQLIRADARAKYLVVRHIAPREPNRAAVGFDIYSEPLRRDAIDRALASGSMAVTAPIELVQAQNNTPGILELLPVTIASPSSDSEVPISGFVVAVIKLTHLIETALGNSVPWGLEFSLTDHQSPVDGEPFYQSSGYQELLALPQTRDRLWQTSLPMGDRRWDLVIAPSPQYLKQHRPWVAWMVGITGLIFAALLQLLILGMTGRASIIQRQNAALKASEERYLHLFNYSPLPTWVYDPKDLHFLMVNERAVTLYGLSREEFLSKRQSDVLASPEHGGACATHTDVTECRHYKADGSVIEVLVHSTPARYGSISARLDIMQDITQDKLNSARLKLADIVFENSGNGLVVTDSRGAVLSINPAFSSITGYETEEMLGQNLRILNSELHPKSFYTEMWQSLMTEDQWQGEIWNRRKNGEVYPEWLSIHTIRNAQGEISYFVGSFSDISSLKAAQDQVAFLAYHDPLTMLPNRLMAKDWLDQSLSRAQRHQARLAVLFMDVDKFKLINDMHGHSKGDRLLQEVALRLQDCIRKEDTLCRISGDEFMAVLYDIEDISGITAQCERILASMALPVIIDELQLSTSMSIGIAIYPQDGETTEILLQHADTAMYEAKASGRNTFRLFDPQMNVRMVSYIRIADALALALQHGEFRLYYQPQLELRSGRIIGCEALLRWAHPEQGLQSPAYFLQTAEESGLIVQIGRWVLNEACRQAMYWRTRGTFFGRVAVNLSALQFMRTDIEQEAIEALETTGLPPEFLELELTESILIQDVDNVLAIINRLQKLGIKISVDDFGTGYSSLTYLKRLNVDKLKIDQSFVRNLCQEPENKAIVQAIIQMAQSLNLNTIAEGVETEEELLQLQALGCNEIQGYYCSQPLGASAFVEYLRAQNYYLLKHKRR